MKLTFLFVLAAWSTFALATPKIVLQKRSDDPCPKGKHEVTVTEISDLVEMKDSGENPTQLKEVRKVCQGNSRHKIKERK